MTVMGQIFSGRSTHLPMFDMLMTAPQLIRALEFVSRELRRKRLHILLVVSGDVLPCLLFGERPTCRAMSILRATKLTPKSLSILSRAIQRAGEKFGLGANWMNTQLESDVPDKLKDSVIYRSLIQKDIVFSSESLTLVAVDHCYALKSQLGEASRVYRDAQLDDAVLLLRRVVFISRGRPLTRGYIRRRYPSIEVSDQMLLRLNAEYEHKFKVRGVVGINDDYLGWRRVGLTWSQEMEEYREELAFALSQREEDPEGWQHDFDRPVPDTPWRPEADLAAIFADKGLYD